MGTPTLTEYPEVKNEFETLAKLKEGFSIARFGDGEFKMIDGAGYTREPANRALAKELRDIARGRGPANLLVAIPTMNPQGPKYASWNRHRERFTRLLHPEVTYYSAFISRPDSAPWIRNAEFAREYESLWRGKKAVVLCEKSGSAIRAVTPGARKLVYLQCPRERAYSVVDLMERAIRDARPEIAILSCGVTATVLARRLARRGIQAIDFGSGGAFIASLLRQR